MDTRTCRFGESGDPDRRRQGSDQGYTDHADRSETDKDKVSKGKIKGKPRVKPAAADHKGKTTGNG